MLALRAIKNKRKVTGMTFLKKTTLILLLSLGLFFMEVNQAFARIDITPTRLIIDSRERSAEITILNLLDEPGTVRISTMNYRQNTDGVYEIIDGPLDPAFDPETMVRISPRQFTLPPGGRQKVRISLRRSADLPDGAYRFHIKATRFANPPENNSETTDGPKVNIGTNIGVVVPVVVNQGDVHTDIKISDVSLVPANQAKSGKPELHLRLNRGGNGAVIGALFAVWEPANGDQSRQIGRLNNVNVFEEVPYRNATIPLAEIPSDPGRMRLIYMDDMNNKIMDEVYIGQ